MNKSQKIKALKKYFEKKPEVILAFLFGSQSKNLAGKISDYDVAVLLKESSKKEKILLKIWKNLVDILNSEVDLIPLDEAPPLLASRILREGIPLKIKDRKIFLDYLIRATDDAEYFLEFSKDYYQIYQRSKSISEVDKARLEKIITFLESSIEEFEEFKKMTFRDYSEDIFKRRNVERWIENLMNSVLDICKIILASKKRPLPDTYRKIFLETSLVLGFGKKFRERFSDWIILRNIIAHEYLEVLWNKIEDFLKNAKPYLERFLKEVKKLV
jgi:uncharacterized protein YutE (UPF0331/DUF86 family)/predicted nucleotidyltransferase